MAEVLGIGIDLCSGAFFRERCRAENVAFYDLTFTSQEQAWCEKAAAARALRYAICFAVKEAAVKALAGQNIRVAAPQVEFDAPTRTVRLVARRGESQTDLKQRRLFLAVSHSGEVARCCTTESARSREVVAIATVLLLRDG